jgi:hypothetical protein
MIGHQFLSKKNTSTAPLHHHTWDTSVADLRASYEALPPNFSLTANMLAGAFAGIAVRPRGRRHVHILTDMPIGTLGDVPGRPAQGAQLSLPSPSCTTDNALTPNRPGCRSSTRRRAPCTAVSRTPWSLYLGRRAFGHSGGDCRVS